MQQHVIDCGPAKFNSHVINCFNFHTFPCVFPADCETGEDVVCALREWRAPPGSAGLGQNTVGGHVRSKTAHKSARQSGVMCVCVCVWGCKERKSYRLCVCVL